jgi:transcriptional regulator with XRE-family HTH domain
MNQETIDKLRRLYKESTNALAKEGAKKKLQDAGISLTADEPKEDKPKMDQATIDKLRRLYNESTNALAKEGAKKKLQDAGISLTAEKPKSEKPKSEPKAEKPKAEPKAKAKSKTTDEYDCDDLIDKEKSRKAKAKANAIKRANAPKKTPATKNKEAVAKTSARVEKNVESRAKKGAVKVAELEKLIAEYETALKRLKTLLSKVKSGKKFAKGGNMGMMDSEHSKEYHNIKEHNCNCGDKKMEHGGNIDDIREVAEKNGLSKGTLMKLAYGDNTRGVDSAIPQGLLEEMGIPNSEYFHYVMDYQNNNYGELVDLYEKISESSYANKISKLNSISDNQLAKIFEDVYGFDSNDVLIEIQGDEQERKNLIRQLVDSPRFLKHEDKMARGGGIDGEIIKDIGTHKAVKKGDKIYIYQKDYDIYSDSEKDIIIDVIPLENEDDLFPMFEDFEEENRINRNEFYARGGGVKAIGKSTADDNYSAKKSGKRTSHQNSLVKMRGNRSYYRRNANQYGETEGGNTYYEYNDNRTDEGRYLEKGGSTNYKKNWEVIYTTYLGEKKKKNITLGNRSTKDDVNYALKDKGLNIYKVISIKEI